MRETAHEFRSQINRRSFVVGAAALGGGLALGFDLPFGPAASHAAIGGPEVNAWVVVQPDETVIIRIARSEMGQGTLTGLAQLAAEELECDWSKVTYEFPTPGQNVARKRAWGDFFTAGSRGIRASNEFVRKGGAAARMMLVQAAADEWKVPAQECTAANGVISHKASNRSTTYGKVADAAGKIEPPSEIKLKDPKDWKIIGKGLKRLDTADKVVGKTEYGIDVRLPGMLYAAIKACPVNGGKVKSFDAAKISAGKGVKKVVQVEDYAVAVIADSWWQAKTALDALPIAWDEGENAKVSSAIHCRVAEGRPRRRSGFCRQQGRRRQSRVGRRRQEGRGGLRLSLSAPRHPGAAERDRALHRRQVRGLVLDARTAKRHWRQHRRRPACRSPSAKCYKTFLGGGFGRRSTSQDYIRQAVLDRQGDAGHAGQAPVVARGGYAARLVPSGHPVQAQRRV